MPYLIAAAMLAPVAPPQAAEGSNAALNISEIASGICLKFKAMIAMPTIYKAVPLKARSFSDP